MSEGACEWQAPYESFRVCSLALVACLELYGGRHAVSDSPVAVEARSGKSVNPDAIRRAANARGLVGDRDVQRVGGTTRAVRDLVHDRVGKRHVRGDEAGEGDIVREAVLAPGLRAHPLTGL